MRQIWLPAIFANIFGLLTFSFTLRSGIMKTVAKARH